MPHPKAEWVHPFDAPSLDHVTPKNPENRALACHRIRKNGLVAHHLCNNKKANSLPHPCELIFLEAINDKVASLRIRSRSY